jgi:hypothetical protein
LLRTPDDPQLHAGQQLGVPAQYALDAACFEKLPQSSCCLVIPNDGNQRCLSAESLDIKGNVRGPSKTLLFPRHPHYRHRRLGGYPIHAPEQIAIKHSVPDHKHSGASQPFAELIRGLVLANQD